MQNLNTNWQQSLSDQMMIEEKGNDGTRRIPLREHPALAKYATQDEAIKALIHAQRMIGGNGRPNVPASPREYVMPELRLPADFVIDEKMRDEYLTRAHQLGLSSEQAAGLFAWFVPMAAEAAEQMRMERDFTQTRELEALRGQHRHNTGRILDDARQAALALGGEELLKALEETGAANKAAVISALSRVAPYVLEGRFRDSNAANQSGITEQTLRRLMKDPRYHDPMQRDPEFVRAIEEGFRLLYPSDTKSSGPRG